MKFDRFGLTAVSLALAFASMPQDAPAQVLDYDECIRQSVVSCENDYAGQDTATVSSCIDGQSGMCSELPGSENHPYPRASLIAGRRDYTSGPAPAPTPQPRQFCYEWRDPNSSGVIFGCVNA